MAETLEKTNQNTPAFTSTPTDFSTLVKRKEFKRVWLPNTLLFLAALSSLFSLLGPKTNPWVTFGSVVFILGIVALSMIREFNKARQEVIDSDERARQADQARKKITQQALELQAAIERARTRIQWLQISVGFKIPEEHRHDAEFDGSLIASDNFHAIGYQSGNCADTVSKLLGYAPNIRTDIIDTPVTPDDEFDSQTFVVINPSFAEACSAHVSNGYLILWFMGIKPYRFPSQTISSASDLIGKRCVMRASGHPLKKYLDWIRIETDAGIHLESTKITVTTDGLVLTEPLQIGDRHARGTMYNGD